MKYEENSFIQKKNNLTIFLFFILYSLIILQLVNVQIIKNEEYVLAANSQYVKNIDDNFNRGKIFFSKENSGSILAAGIREEIKIRNGKEITIRNRIYPLGEVGAKVLGFVG